jgi:hypothetical protein
MGSHTTISQSESQTVTFEVPKSLFERVEKLCSRREIPLDTFIIDAITEKLQNAYRERRRKQRL